MDYRLLLLALVVTFVAAQGDNQCDLGKLDAQERQSILQTLNELRQRVAQGEEKLPTAANMKQLVWDPLLEAKAASWARQCKTGNSDVEQRYLNWNITIRELSAVITSNKPYAEAKWARGFEGWFRAKTKLTETFLEKYDNKSQLAADSEVRAATQLIWANTEFVGCAVSILPSESKPFKQYLVCDFAYAGNIDGQSVYLHGDPATECPKDFVKSARFPALCTRSKAAVLTA